MYLTPLKGLYFSPYMSRRFTFNPEKKQKWEYKVRSEVLEISFLCLTVLFPLSKLRSARKLVYVPTPFTSSCSLKQQKGPFLSPNHSFPGRERIFLFCFTQWGHILLTRNELLNRWVHLLMHMYAALLFPIMSVKQRTNFRSLLK